MTSELKNVLKPAVHLCLKNALGVRELLEAARWVFVDQAANELKDAGEKLNVSRLAIMTGLQRPVVKECLENRPVQDPSRFTIRVISTWRNSKKFLGKNKQPKVLSYEGDNSDFAKLVRTVGSDLHPGTILFDLQRLNLVDVSPTGVKLKSKGYITKRDVKKGYEHLARDTEDLMTAVIDNLEWKKGQLPNYHGTTSFDNIDESDLEEIRDWIFDKFSKFHQDVEKHLATYDLDLNPSSKKPGGKRVMMGLYSKTT